MCATPHRSRCTRTPCWRPCTLSVPRMIAKAAFARASWLAGADCADDCVWATAASARVIANIEIDFFIADSLNLLVCPAQFLGKAPRAYTTRRQDARACRLGWMAAMEPRQGEYSDAPLQILLCFVGSLLCGFAFRCSATASRERFFSSSPIRAERCCLFGDGRLELRASSRKNRSPSDGPLAHRRKPAPPHRRNRRPCQ